MPNFEMKHIALFLLLAGATLLPGCSERRCSERDAIKKAISFEADSETIKSVFDSLPGLSTDQALNLVSQKLGTNNLSSFLIMQNSDGAIGYELYVDLQSTIPVSRCGVKGESLVKLSDLSEIKIRQDKKEREGSFVFDIKDSYRGVCKFVMMETYKGYMITRLSIPSRKDAGDTPELTVFSIDQTHHLLPAKDRPFFKEITK